MPNYTMCLNDDCSINETCLRYTAQPDINSQAFQYFSQKPNGKCVYFMKEEKVKRGCRENN